MVISGVSSGALWVGKVLLLVVAGVFAYEGKLTPEAAAMFATGLGTLGITNAATILAQTRFFGTLLHQFTPGVGSSTPATSVPPPPASPPPVPPSSLPKTAATVAGLALVFCGLGACAESLLTPADHGATNTEMAEQVACVRDHSGDAAAMTACRTAVRAHWDRYWTEELDGGKDGP